MFNHKHPEFASVETFVQYLLDEERESFLPGEAQAVAKAIGSDLATVTRTLQDYGLILMNRTVQKATRGITSNPNGTFPFSGANSTFTTSGSDSIIGFAGRAGY